MAPIRIGQVISGRYRVDQFIAAGGMGAVYRVWDLQRGASLAMKVLHTDLADDPSYLRRFQREADSLEQLAHPNIVRFYGIHQDGSTAFLLTDYIDGPSLKELLSQRRGSPLSLVQSLTFLRALSAALGYAHHNGIVHSDVKPGNVLLDQGGSIFLTDFGFARSSQATSTTIGSAGTPSYMAPEQIRGERLTPSADIYSLGVLFFELLTGRRPFRGDEAETLQVAASTTDRIVYAHLHLSPPPISTVNSSLPLALDQVLARSLDKDPAARYPDTSAFLSACLDAASVGFSTVPDRASPALLSAVAWEPTLSGTPPTIVDRQPPTPPPSPPVQPPAEPSDQVPPHSPARPRWLLPALAGVALLVLLVIALFFTKPWGGAPASPPAALGATATLPVLVETSPLLPTSTSVPTPSPQPATQVPPIPAPTQDDSTWEQGKLVYVLRGSAGWSLHSLDLTRSLEPELIALPPDGQRFMGPVWSPDGSKIALYNQTTKDLLVVDAQPGSQPTKLADGTQPSWSPDGSRILYRPEGGVFAILDALTGEQTDRREVPPGANLPDWSPQDDVVAYSIIAADNSTSIWIQPFSVGGSQPLADSSAQNYAPAWSHDGRFIAYQSDQDAANSEIWVMDRDGRNPRRLTFSPPGTWSRAPSWSPDDQWLAFVSSQAGSTGADFGEIFVIPVKGGEPTRITDSGGEILDWRVDWGPQTQDPRRIAEPYLPLDRCAPSRLHLGEWVYITYGGGQNAIRSTPDIHASDNWVGTAQEGELLKIIGGPECSFNYILWEVQATSGLIGWTPESDGEEFWLEPFPAWLPCQTAPPSDLLVGEIAIVAPYPPDANKVRQQPGMNGLQTGVINPMEQVEMLDGPVCQDDLVWWQVQSLESGLHGWTAEGQPGSDWLIPLPEK